MPTTETPVFWIIWAGLALGVIVAVAIGLTAYGAMHWAKTTRALMFRLEESRIPLTTAHYNDHELEGLPMPVIRYFRAVLKNGQPIIAAATVEHIGNFNMSPTGDQWKPFTSVQRVLTQRPGFLWNARIAMALGVDVYVHDAYIAGEGTLNPAIAGLFSLARAVKPRDLAQGEFVRFFAETAWYPTALLPSQGVRWEAVDDHSAKATLADGTISSTMLVRFNTTGLIDSVRVEARAAMVRNTVIQTPWEGRWSNYQMRGGMQVPLTGEAAWLHPAGRQPYWRGTIKSITYEFSDDQPIRA